MAYEFENLSTCGWSGGGVDDSSVEMQLGVGSCHATLDAQHLTEGVLVTELHLEVVPLHPESAVDARIRKRRRVHVNRARSVHLTDLEIEWSPHKTVSNNTTSVLGQ